MTGRGGGEGRRREGLRGRRGDSLLLAHATGQSRNISSVAFFFVFFFLHVYKTGFTVREMDYLLLGAPPSSVLMYWFVCLFVYLFVCFAHKRNRQKDIETDKQADRHRQADRERRLGGHGQSRRKRVKFHAINS